MGMVSKHEKLCCLCFNTSKRGIIWSPLKSIFMQTSPDRHGYVVCINKCILNAYRILLEIAILQRIFFKNAQGVKGASPPVLFSCSRDIGGTLDISVFLILSVGPTPGVTESSF